MIQSEYLYSSDIIYSWNENSIVHGKIYGIVEADNLKNAINRVHYILPDVNTSEVVDINLSSSIPGEIRLGEYHWYKFVAETPGIYSFYTEGDMDSYGELFEAVVPARSTEGLLVENDDEDLLEDLLNFKMEYALEEGQTVYLRVRGYAWLDTGLYSVRVEKIVRSD